MFIVVNHSDDFGLEECGRFDTKAEAFKTVADGVAKWYDFEIDMSDYPFNDVEEVHFNGTDIYFGDCWCTCICKEYTDRWLIIEA